MVGAVGIEPTTFGLKGRCSTTELRPCWQHLFILACTSRGRNFAFRVLAPRGLVRGGTDYEISAAARRLRFQI